MDSSDGPLLWGLIFALLMLVSFLMSAFSGALRNVPENPQGGDDGPDEKKNRYFRALGADPSAFEYARRFWIYAAVFAAIMFSRQFGAQWRIAAPALLLAAIFVFAEAFPLPLGSHYPQPVADALWRPASLLQKAVLPLTFVLRQLTALLLLPFHTRPGAEDDEVTEDEIISMVNEGHEQGVLDEHEAEMIQNIFELDEKEARDIMTHRKNINALSADTNLREAIAYMTGQTNSRYPVYDGGINNIVGVLHFRDAMVFHYRGDCDDVSIGSIPGLLRDVIFIPETRDISRLFRSMQAQKLQMAVVVDEYGETAGLVTMEDILEEIVGNILDESDEEERMIIPQQDGSFLMDGMTPLEDVGEALGVSFDEEEYDTLNGYLVYRMDRIPDEKDRTVIKARGYLFTIREVQAKTIKWVSVAKAPSEAPEEPVTVLEDGAALTAITKEKKE